jgi:hypothetical protein
MTRIAMLALALGAAASAADYRDVNKTLPLHGNGSLEIETHKGGIRVSVWDRQEVEIQARIQPEPGTIMDRRQFDGTEVRIASSSAASVRVNTYYPDHPGCCSDNVTNPEVRYTIRMPKTAKLIIRDHRSDTEVSGLQGALDLETHRGGVRLHGLTGALRLDNYRGDVQVEFASFTANSSITTYRGNVQLSMPRSSRFDLQTNSGRHGSIATDFSVMARTFVRHGEGVHGTVNGGGPTMRIETDRGDVTLHGK